MTGKNGSQNQNAAPQPAISLSQPGILQRTCKCGAVSGLTGECEACGSQRLSRQWRASPPAGPPPSDGATMPRPQGKGFRFQDLAIHSQERAGIQPKLTIGQPNDKYEQEADRVAEHVMRMPEPKPWLQRMERSVRPGAVQRQSLEKREKEQVQAKPLAEQITPLVQRQAEPRDEEEEKEKEKEKETLQPKTASGQTSTVSPSLQNHITVLQEGGQPLSQSERSFFEPRFGADFSHVRIHADHRATEAANAVNARAFTVGRNIVFGTGQYQPQSSVGQHLLAHELTHVVQQTQPSSANSHGLLFKPDSHEMIPGYTEQFASRSISPTSSLMIQGDKIKYRQLTWDDFQAKAPKKSKYSARIYSDFHDPALKDLIPEKLTAVDTGKECTLKKTAKGKVKGYVIPVDTGKESELKKTAKSEVKESTIKTTAKDELKGHIFKVNIKIDPDAIHVKSYMLQDKSWKQPWLTKAKAAQKYCKENFTKKCEKHFTKEYKRINKECKKHQKDCKQEFKKIVKQINKQCKKDRQDCQKGFDEKDYSSMAFSYSGQEVVIKSKDGCEKILPEKCKKLLKKQLFKQAYEFAGQEIVIKSEDECDKILPEKCKKLLKETVDWSGEMAGVTATAKSKDDCSKKIIEECVEKMIPVARQKVLRHEQVHFDVTNSIAMRTQDALRTLAKKFDKELNYCGDASTEKAMKASQKKAIGEAEKKLAKYLKSLQKEYKKGKDNLDKVQKTYDIETDHGTKQLKQETWEQGLEEKIQKLLETESP